MKKEEYLRGLMIQKHGTVKEFSRRVNLPYSTVLSILERGIRNAKADNVFIICKELGIRPETLTPTIIEQLNDKNHKLVMEYAAQKLREQNDPHHTIRYRIRRRQK